VCHTQFIFLPPTRDPGLIAGGCLILIEEKKKENHNGVEGRKKEGRKMGEKTWKNDTHIQV
jgi:hypothetical protein